MQHKVPSGSTDSSSELVPFVGRLCSTLAELVSEMKSLFTESSPSDGTAVLGVLCDELSLLNGNTLLDVLFEGFSLLYSLLFYTDSAFENILIDSNFVPLLKSTIVACLDLLDQQKSDSNCPPTGRTDMMLDVLDWLWDCTASCLRDGRKSLTRIVESTLSDVPQLCSLLERTCNRTSLKHFSHLGMIINLTHNLPHLIPRLLEENLVERVLNTTKPMTVPTAHGRFHLRLIWAIRNLMKTPIVITQNKEEWKRIRKLQFEHVLKPAKQYLQFILQREEFVSIVNTSGWNLPTELSYLFVRMLLLERDLFEDGEIVETGREEWEVGWLAEKTNEKELGERLKKIREDDVRMKKNEKSRWKKRVERQREAGHEDAMEGWLTRKDNGTRSEIEEYLRQVRKERAMNNTQ
ncbi:hypothetical protein BLNAU_8043 [Blattamonas nauphoetae]|uniref:Uncharacterized protein n=1 Tax=Blattamonas nauphoetae TaxID=2049346 RepID=A0ABQ9XZS1_9EUKA|nr:hypothetical protein BLNAU_8043 [Blattamonas nauphoetae]